MIPAPPGLIARFTQTSGLATRPVIAFADSANGERRALVLDQRIGALIPAANVPNFHSVVESATVPLRVDDEGAVSEIGLPDDTIRIYHAHDRPPKTPRYVTYDDEANAAYCRIIPTGDVTRCVDVGHGVIVEVDGDGNAVAVELLNVRGWLGTYRPSATTDSASGTIDPAGAQT